VRKQRQVPAPSVERRAAGPASPTTLKLFLTIGLCGLVIWLDRNDAFRASLPEREIYRGVYYRRMQLPRTTAGWGNVHVVRIDLQAPGIQLFVTPMENQSERPYRLTMINRTVREQDLAVAVNGPPFDAHRAPFPFPGERAHSVETVVSDHVVGHQGPHSYLLWFDDNNRAHVDHRKPASPEILRRARWAVGSELIVLADGRVNTAPARRVDRRTIAAIDSRHNVLWLALFERATYQLAARTLAGLGADWAVILDGGSSSAMAFGSEARQARPGSVCGLHVPPATVLGVRAQPLPK